MKNKVVAGVLALFCGWIGIHKFYLGQNFAGVLYLLFSWTTIPAIIAFFEGLGLLLMSEQRFNAQFNSMYMQGSSTPVMAETTRDKAAAIAELKNLYDMGAITAEEFEAKRRKILDSM